MIVLNKEFINNLIEEEIKFSDELSKKYNYPDNITHLLYLIIPAFIIKYKTTNRFIIEKCFETVPIYINDKQDKIYQAYYVSLPKYVDGKAVTKKKIVLNNYENIPLMQLIDNLVHEYNHAVNSMQNEINIDNMITIRTGISLNYFNKSNLKFIKKSDEVILEEVINTRQTESIIDIIKSFNDLEITNTIVANTLYSINYSINNNYKSDSYYLESMVCKELMENRTFISTFETLRFEGQIDDLHDFFDNITGKKGSLMELSKLLNKSLELQKELPKVKFFKKSKIEKIKSLTQEALAIVNTFNNNTTFK